MIWFFGLIVIVALAILVGVVFMSNPDFKAKLIAFAAAAAVAAAAFWDQLQVWWPW